ncbi:pentapeptide repeat-containing protein [Halorhabdus sp. BNX81]|uniref:pentapeptide repeat-containing protein n=1 Tax=Halorhabdus sp. BNX81 TaxID=2980181 RepID=UPI0023DD04CD|nr:pentapeptide repeat-containing protein [Halorhabdus sp. BNX81]
MQEENFWEYYGIGTCWRETWENGKCIWHADEQDKPSNEIIERQLAEWNDENPLSDSDLEPWEDLDGAILDSVIFDRKPNFSKCSLQFSSFDSVKCEGIDLREAILLGSDFTNSYLQGARLEEANMRKTKFENAYLGSASLENANIEHSNFKSGIFANSLFSNARLTNTTFDDSNLQNAKLNHTMATKTSFKKSNLTGVELVDGVFREGDFEKAVLRDADASKSDLRFTTFEQANLRDANLNEANLFRSNLKNAKLPFASLERALLRRANLNEANLSDAKLVDASANDSDLENANLSESTLKNSSFTDASLKKTNINLAELDDANFQRADLEQSDLSMSSCSGTNFESSNLNYVDADGTNFTDARLYKARLQDIYITGSTDFGDRCFYDKEAGPIEYHSSLYKRLINSFNRFRYWMKITPNKTEEPVEDLSRAQHIYRIYERLHRENSLIDGISSNFVKAKYAQQRLKLAKNQWLGWLDLSARRWTMQYGESPWRIIGTSLFIIGLFALLYPLSGGVITSGDGIAHEIISPFDISLYDAPVGGWLLSVYFSTVTFTTLGFGDVSPNGALAQTLAAAESFMGAILLALFVAVVARRKMR